MKWRMEDYIKSVFPDALFTEADGSPMYWNNSMGETMMQFYPNEEARKNDLFHTCIVEDGEFVIMSKYDDVLFRSGSIWGR